ncbi:MULTISPECIES: hypothetical protein [Clostridium]|uniref:Uncharacterized protein n=1 Tax=Clostridium sporogenes TaxID=1509 RepID=A0A7X5PA14_CLOSG|nr:MULTISPECIES: hypothetical protein [Clostridium]AJD31467.1 hypothetical protein T258_2241 [Clostridium botulinum Prevot_594]KRU39259.1 hypothetical protein VT94_28220 [Clostridium sporogenes]MBY7013146.1 hypothetical protein [Clostridium sporogenes]MBY7063315.1 hypothetical protein [Clostridium sporogenes]MBY7070252.1 hypothetical protein [Clostridium sporogenes]
MRNHKNYLLTLNQPPTIAPQNASIGKIYDWNAGESFTVVNVVSSQSPWAKSVHVLATRDNAYSAQNLQNSRLLYRSSDEQSESREVIGITELD